MDREKLNKAAEKALENNFFDDEAEYIIGKNNFKIGASWLMQQPLSERLTDEEKKKIRKRYKDELEVAQHHTIKMEESTNPTCRQFYANVREAYISRLKLLEQIFGADLFKEI